jgi:hypothetical protein
MPSGILCHRCDTLAAYTCRKCNRPCCTGHARLDRAEDSRAAPLCLCPACAGGRLGVVALLALGAAVLLALLLLALRR